MKPTPTHFIGIGGIGMSAVARLMLLQKQVVTGSDKQESPLTEELKRLGAKIYIGHDAMNLPESGRVVISTGIKKDNPELAGCSPEKHELLHRSAMLRDLMSGQKSLLVTGTHGKTTTSSLLVTLLKEGEKSPSWAVGGIVSHYGTNADLGEGDFFIAEADESDGSHLNYNPWGLIVTNIDRDHMDYFKTKEALAESLKAFCSKVASLEHLFWCGDDATLKQLNLPGISYGFDPSNALRITDFRQEGDRSIISIFFEGREYKEFETNLMGVHNALNASACVGMALKLGLEEEAIRRGLKAFKGVKRRAEIKGFQREVLVIDDYAHHPTEIAATLAGIRKAYPERALIAVFQPHRYSRTRDCFNDFAPTFEKADEVILTDLYGAGEEPLEGISSQELIKTFKKGSFVLKERLIETLKEKIKPFDVVVFMGAGDITYKAAEFAGQTPRRLKVGIVFGGTSTEHEISLLSARNIAQSLELDWIERHYFALTASGDWISGEEAKNSLQSESRIVTASEHSLFEALKRLKECDVIFPVLHGYPEEAGPFQGFLETLGLPYVGCSVESSSITMNKAVTKKLAEHAAIPVAEYVDFTAAEWSLNRSEILQKIEGSLSYPMFVKPVHQGSTWGVKKVTHMEELKRAIKEAFVLDRHIIVERSVKGREIECSVVGQGPWFVSLPGEIMVKGAVYTYEDKYGPQATEVSVRADLSESQVKEAQELALRSYRAAVCDGMARVDLFWDEEQNRFLLNEINPIPGCTKNSLFPKMCESSGLPMEPLMKRLLLLAMGRDRVRAHV